MTEVVWVAVSFISLYDGASGVRKLEAVLEDQWILSEPVEKKDVSPMEESRDREE